MPQRVKIEFRQGLLFCEAEIHSKKKKSFLIHLAVDTGATVTIISPDAARFIGINPAFSKRVREVTTGSGSVMCPLITIPYFICLGQTIKNLEVFCHTLPEESPVEGLLGLNFLKNFDIRINFRKGYLETS